LRDEGTRIRAAWLKDHVGKVSNVLVELDGTSGHADNFARVLLPSLKDQSGDLKNTIISVRMTGIEGDALVGVPA
jgi:threonylcarbamoyladenosine tRNA methylthiotransferase MtaB